MMRRNHIIYAFLLLAPPILYWFYQQPSNARSSEDLRACVAEFEKLRVEAAKIKPVDLFPFLQGYQQLGYRDKKGEMMIPPRFTEARNFSQGKAVVADRNWYKGFINSKGELVIPHKFVWVSDFSKGIAVFSGTKEDREQKGFIDLRGNVVLTFKGASPDPEFNGFEDGRVSVYVHDLSRGYGNPVSKIYGYVDCTGKVTLKK